MALDPLARKLTIPYPGGSVTATRGLLYALFGKELVETAAGTPRTVNRSAHSRTRVIGGASTSVAGANYTIGKYPTARFNGGSGGQPIRVNLDGEWWTLRVNGSLQKFADWAKGANWVTDAAVAFVSEKGTSYGPFK